MTEYCFDTSAWLDAWVRNYPHDVFPTVWTNIEQLISLGGIICPDEVLVEVEKKDDGFYAWAKAHKNMFREIDSDLQKALVDILGTFPGLAAEKSFRHHADPFVIALARITGRTVVTGEKNKGRNNELHVKIPYVCGYYKIRCINILEFMREQGWCF